MQAPPNKTFKFNPIDPELQKQLVSKLINPSQNFYEFLCEIQPFSFEGDSSEFNQWFLNGEFGQKDVLELVYVSSFQKTCLLNYILISFFTSPDFMNLEESITRPMPELIYIDTTNNFNILALHGLISENLFFRSTLNPNFKNQNYVEALITNIFSHLHIYRVYDIDQFLSTLRMLPFIIDKNKQIKLIIIDSINNFPIYEHHNYQHKGHNVGSKEKAANEVFFNYNTTDKKTMKKLMKLVDEAKNVRDIGFIVTKKEIYKTNEMIGFNFKEKCLHANSRLMKTFKNFFFKEGSNMIFLMSFYSFEEAALNLIYNDMEILQKLDSFNVQSYSVADIIHNGNLCFAIKLQNKNSEVLCYNINKSNFFYLKRYPCILIDS